METADDNSPTNVADSNMADLIVAEPDTNEAESTAEPTEDKPSSDCGIADSTSNSIVDSSNQTVKDDDVESDVATNDVSENYDIENEVYNIVEEAEPMPMTTDSLHDDAELNQRAPKRTMAVITIDSDSDDSSVCHVESYQATASEAKKMRKGYSSSESETESSSDESDYESDEASVIIGNPSSISMNNSISKKATGNIEIKMNECFSSEHLNEEFLSHWSKGEPFTAKNITLHSDPFQICILEDFLSNPEAIEKIVDNMNTLDWSRRIMDLYEYHRTVNLSELTWQRSITSIYELLKDNVMKWVARITNTNLTSISASCALYGPGDHLLVHDDMLEDRKIAFIFYMSPFNISNIKADDEDIDDSNGSCKEPETADGKGWLKSMGGELEFFSTDDKGQPGAAVKTLLPQNNTFAFFKVSNKSFHRVAEVTTYDYPRLTINGWFHGPPDPDDQQPAKADEEAEVSESTESYNTVFPPNSDVFQQSLNEWITSIYLSPKCKNQILQKFEETSEISLVNYFIESKYDEVLTALRSEHLSWNNCGPINLRNYQTASNTDVLANEHLTALLDLQNILTCKFFVSLLQGYTALPIQSYCRFEIQRWTAGNYTVLPVKGEYSASEVDIIVYLGCPDRFLKGGSITYLLPEEPDSDPVISVGLKNNALNIVYSEAGLARFTKYVSKLSLKEGEYFYMLVCSYRNTEPK